MDSNALSQKFKEGEGKYFAALRLPGGERNVYFFYGKHEPVLKSIGKQIEVFPQFICSPYGAGDLAYHLEPAVVEYNDEVIYTSGQPIASLSSSPSDHPHKRSSDESSYQSYVGKCVNEIRSKQLRKVVAARSDSFRLKEGFDSAALFSKLCDKYASATVYYFNFGSIGNWMGATPELLLRSNEDRFETVAIAGTRSVNGNKEWTQKEYEEQEVTAVFIRNLLKKLNFKFRESTVQTIQAGEIEHLCSRFEWPGNSTMSISKIIKLLNPTPAVCGMPQDKAFSFIARNEGIDRKFYSGFIGMMTEHTTELYVNLRCMEMHDGNAMIYAGAGITADSDPRHEWEETQQKMDTLRKLI